MSLLLSPINFNKFRYAALIQQEKNKVLKLKYASIIKRKQQMVDLIKQQAYIRASIFRDEIAKHELQHILNAADDNVSVDGNDTTGTPSKNGKPCHRDGDPKGTLKGIWSDGKYI